MTVPVLLLTSPTPEDNYLVHAVAAARNAISYLHQRSEVDPGRIGMVGLSWGGVITLLTNGQDTRLKTAVDVFGAGYIPQGCTWQKRFDNKSEQELSEWYRYIDPKNFLLTQNAPILFITGTNDHCYYLPTFQKSYGEAAAAKNLYLVPNLQHRFLPDTQSVVWQWFDSQLKNKGKFPEIELLLARKKHDKIVLPLNISSSSKVAEVALYYAKGLPTKFTRKKWQKLPAYISNGVYYFSLPADLIRPEIMFFATVFDEAGRAASTPVRSIFEVTDNEGQLTYALSGPIEKINSHGKTSQIVGVVDPEKYWVRFSTEVMSYQLVKK